jgi:hypothetical protein
MALRFNWTRPLGLGALGLMLLGLAPMRSLAVGSDVTAAPSLNMILGARGAAMGGANSALADDSESMLYNPAGLTELREVEMAASHLAWLDGVNDESVQLGIPVFGLGAWGLGATYLYSNDQGRDNWGTPTGTFTDFDFSMQAAFALQLGDNASVGLEYRIIRQGYNAADNVAGARLDMGSSFDLGISRKAFDRRLNLSLGVDNIGTNLGLGVTDAPLPLTFKGAAAWHFNSNLAAEVDYLNEPYDFLNTVRAGAEYQYPLGDETSASFRVGYDYDSSVSAIGGLDGYTAGIGAQWQAWKVDYAFVPKGDLGLSQYITLTVGFGQH